MQNEAQATPKLAVGDEFTVGKARWKITTVYGFRPAYSANLYAAVRRVKSTGKWSSVAYLKTERGMRKDGA